MKLTKYFLGTFVVIFSLLSISSTVFAQYDTDVIEPEYQNGEEVFGINTQSDKKVSVYPEGCKGIERIVISLKGEIDGEIRISSSNENTPVEGKQIDKAYEYCSFKYTGIEREDIESMTIDSKIRKSWLSSESVDESDIALYTFDNGWKNEKTNKETDNTIYSFYKTEIGFTEYIALGEYQGNSLPFGLNPWIIIVCCVGLLFLLLLISILYSFMNRRKTGTQYNTTY